MGFKMWPFRHLLWVFVLSLCGSLKASDSPSEILQNLPAPPLIEPGYTPGPEAAKDVRGLWMEMAEAEQILRRSPLVVDDPLINDYVKNIACEVAHAYCNDLRIYVIRNPHFNASIAPNGLMMINSGLLVRLTSSDQLAAILGHEFAHYSQTHSLGLLRKMKQDFAVAAFVSLLGIPDILALTSVLSFNRGQEAEADELGAYYMAAAGYRPEAAKTAWDLLNEEEAAASVKLRQGLLFLSSHPRPKDRARKLEAVANQIRAMSPEIQPLAEDPLPRLLQERYALLMDEQLQQRDKGRLLTLLARHEALGIQATDVAFYRGEALRLSGESKDVAGAMDAYRQALAAENPNPLAYRELGYLEYKHGDREVAEGYFQSFLALVPNASDKEMIEFYLGGGW